MTTQIPVKAITTGTTATALAQFASGDTIDPAYLPSPSMLTATASGALNAQAVVAIANGLAYTPDLTNSNDVQRVVGVTTGAAADGAQVTIATQATFTESGWGWSPGPLYCAVTGGGLTQTAPTTGAVLEVGKALTATSITVLIHRPILRE